MNCVGTVAPLIPSVLPGDGLPGLYCSHLHVLLVFEAFYLQCGLQQLKHILSWIKVGD